MKWPAVEVIQWMESEFTLGELTLKYPINEVYERLIKLGNEELS